MSDCLLLDALSAGEDSDGLELGEGEGLLPVGVGTV